MRFESDDPWYLNEDFWTEYRSLMFDSDRLADTVREAEGILRLARPPAGGSLLDLCCGEGRHAIEMARQGFSVTGVDTNGPYLKTARSRGAEAGAAVEWVQEDVRRFVRPAAYDLAYNFFTSFGYFEEPEDDRKMVARVRNSLKPGGAFLIDTIGKETAALHFKPREWFQRDGYLIMLEYRIRDGWNSIENRWLFIEDDHRRDTKLREIVFQHRLYSAQEMGELLTEAGFESVEFYGALDGRLYDENAERMIALARVPHHEA